MRALPLVPDGCTLSPDGLALQLQRATSLTPAVSSVSRSQDAFRVSFAAGVDEAVVAELVETELDCCSFLEIGYDGASRVLHVESREPRGREVVRQLASAFGGEVR